MIQRLWQACRQQAKAGWQIVRAHRKAVLVFIFGFLLLWAVTAGTWLYSADGYSYGMQPVVFWLHFGFLLAAGVFAMSRSSSLANRVSWAVAFVLGYCALDMAALLVWSGLLTTLGKTRLNPQFAGPTEGLIEVLHMSLAFVIVGLALALLGGLLTWLYSASKHAFYRRK
jgi:hypothetical protein